MTHIADFEAERLLDDERRNVQINTRQTLLTKILLGHLSRDLDCSEADVIERAISELYDQHEMDVRRRSIVNLAYANQDTCNKEDMLALPQTGHQINYANYGRPWSDQDDQILRQCLSSSRASYHALSRKLGRTIISVKARAVHLGLITGKERK